MISDIFNKIFKKRKREDDFVRALNFTLKYEGGYVNNKTDRGGETNFGISKRAYPDLDIKNLTKALATVIYRQDYWEKGQCHELPFPLDIVHFDACVHHGVGRARKILDSAKGDPDLKTYCLNVIRERAIFFHRICARMPHQKIFLNGWLNRIEALKNEIHSTENI